MKDKVSNFNKDKKTTYMSKLLWIFIKTNPNMEYVIIDPIKEFGSIVNPICIIIFHKTSDNSAKK